MNPELQGYADAVLSGTGSDQARPLVDELDAIYRLVSGSQVLDAALTDTSLRPAQRRAVLDDLLGGRVGDGARRIAGFAASAVPAPEVPSTLEWLVHLARRRIEGLDIEGTVVGYRAARARVGGFADALFEESEVADLEEMEDELFRFARTVESTPALRTALSSRELPVEVRRAVVGDLLAGKVLERTRRLVEYVITAGRARSVVGTLDWLVERTAAARGWRVARVRTAREIDAAQQDRLAEAIGQLTGRAVELQMTVEPSLLGGVVIEVGDIQVDASAEGRLLHLREHLEPGGWDATLGKDASEVAPDTGAAKSTGGGR